METGYLLGAIIFALLVVVTILGLGIYALMRGGKFGERWSNKLMQFRVIAQAGAIIVILAVAAIAMSGRH